MTAKWPTARLDSVERLRVLRGSLHAPVFAETYFPLPVDVVWAVASDLEREIPRLIPPVRSFRLQDPGDGHRPTAAVAVGPTGRRVPFEVTLEPGWCLMQGRRVVGGMAAVPEGEGTRFAVVGGGRGRLLELRRLVFAWPGRRLSRHIMRTLRRRLAEVESS
jgi:hypothetical protein